jgi:hypothetical protein
MFLEKINESIYVNELGELNITIFKEHLTQVINKLNIFMNFSSNIKQQLD